VIVNGVIHETMSSPRSVGDLLRQLGIEPRGIAVAINGEIARRSQWETTMINASDSVEIVTAVAGG
jgi:sulfur carrier protein